MISHDSPQAPTARSTTAVFALVRIYGLTIAVPSACVTLAVERPAKLTQVPRRAGPIDGLMSIGGEMVPVLNLQRWLAAPNCVVEGTDPTGSNPGGLVLLLKSGASRVGLSIEAVLGVLRATPEQVTRLFHDDDTDELFQSAALPNRDSEPIPILEAGRLMSLSGVWAAAAGLGREEGRLEDRSNAGEDRSPAAEAVLHASFRIGGSRIAVPATAVGELMRRPSLRQELPSHDGVLGLCEWRGRLVPVVDLAGALGALPSGDEAGWLCMVSQGDLVIGILVHELLEITKLAAKGRTHEHGGGVKDSLVDRHVISQGQTLAVIDIDALLHRYPETGISNAGASQAKRSVQADVIAPAYMVFEAHGMFAARIDGVQEVLPMPEEVRVHLDAGVPATLQWRNQAIPVSAIPDSMVSMPTKAGRQLIIITQAGKASALPISGVKAMVPRGVGQLRRVRLQGRSAEVISVETEDHRASYPVVQLEAAC